MRGAQGGDRGRAHRRPASEEWHRCGHRSRLACPGAVSGGDQDQRARDSRGAGRRCCCVGYLLLQVCTGQVPVLT